MDNPENTLKQKQINITPQPIKACETYEKLEEFDKETEKSGALKITNKTTNRPKRPYYEHYSKEGVFEPMLEYVRNHPNPSGKPPNIPQSMYTGEVVPKRPWVYFGQQNVPPSDCPQINEKNFFIIFQKVKTEKKQNSGILKKSNKKKGIKRNEDEFSEMTDEATSNFTFSDSVDLSKQSDLISQFRSQTKLLKQYDSSYMSESEADDDFSSVSGSVTQRHRYNLFDSSESEQQEESNNSDRQRKNKFSQILEESDEEQSDMGPSSSPMGSSGHLNAKSDKGSSVKVQIDEEQSSMSMSKSKSQSNKNKISIDAPVKKGKGKEKEGKAKAKKHSKSNKKKKLTVDSESDSI